MIDDNTLDEIEAEMAMEMGSDPVDLCRREIEAHAHKSLGPIIAELPETWGVIPELRSIGEVVDLVVCRSFASDAERKAFELGKPARFQWLLRLNLDLRAHGYRNNVEEAFNEIAVALRKCGPAIFYQARFRKSALSQEEWNRLSRKSVFSLRRRRARRSPVTKTV